MIDLGKGILKEALGQLRRIQQRPRPSFDLPPGKLSQGKLEFSCN
jgi:hypothetical protein